MVPSLPLLLLMGLSVCAVAGDGGDKLTLGTEAGSWVTVNLQVLLGDALPREGGGPHWRRCRSPPQLPEGNAIIRLTLSTGSSHVKSSKKCVC